MAEQIERLTKTLDAVVMTNAIGTTAEIEMEGMSQGTVWVPSTGNTTITWYGAQKSASQPNGPQGPAVAANYLPLYDSTLAGGNAVVQSIGSSHAVQLPAALFGCAAVKGVTNSGNMTVQVCLKS